MITLFFLWFVQSAQAEKLKVGVSPAVSSAGIFLAFEEGYYKEQGLEVDLISIPNSGAGMTLLLSKGELDVGAGNLSSGLFNAIRSGEKVKLVADKGHTKKNFDYIQLVVREDHFKSGRFKTLKDLKGFKVAFTSLDGVSQQVVFNKVLKKAGLDAEDVEYVKASYAEMNVAMKAKTLDAAVQLEPYLAAGLEDRIFRIVEEARDKMRDQQSAAILFSPHLISKRRADGEKFIKAYLKGVSLYNKGLKNKKIWETVVSSLKKHIQIERASVWNNMKPVGLRNDGFLDKKAVMADLKWYKSMSYVPEMPSEEEIFDLSFIGWAQK